MRLEHFKPRYGEDIFDTTLSQETQQMHALNFNKGCYIGQEIVERVRSRGLVHRLLAGVEIDSQDVPAPDTRLLHGEENAGKMTSRRVLAGAGQGRGTGLRAPRAGRAGHDAHRQRPRRRSARAT